MAKKKRPPKPLDPPPANHPFVVWAAGFLWFTSVFAVAWSLLLLHSASDMLSLTGTYIINLIVLLSGIILFPTNAFIMSAVSNNDKVENTSTVMCCPMWVCILWTIILNLAGCVFCIQKMLYCYAAIHTTIQEGMRQYRSVPTYKHFLDNVQWGLKCCGADSYKDWFSVHWYDRAPDYDWNPIPRKRQAFPGGGEAPSDSVPQSCCKIGACISNFLTELGVFTINTRGCSPAVNRLVMIYSCSHLTMFFSVIILEYLMLRYMSCIFDEKKLLELKLQREQKNKKKRRQNAEVEHFMIVNNNFNTSSGSYQIFPEENDQQPLIGTGQISLE